MTKKSLMSLLALGLALVGCRNVESLKKECNDGHADACESACKKGWGGPGGCISAAKMYEKGDGVQKNMRRSVALLVQGCDSKYGQACIGAAVAYAKGEGIEQNRSQAVRLLEKGCRLGLGKEDGCSFAGQEYLSGESVAKNVTLALELYELGCTQGNPTSCRAIGDYYNFGERNVEKATAGYERYCKAASEPVESCGPLKDLNDWKSEQAKLAKERAEFEESMKVIERDRAAQAATR